MPAGVHFAAMHDNRTEAIQSILVLKFMGRKDSSPIQRATRISFPHQLQQRNWTKVP